MVSSSTVDQGMLASHESQLRGGGRPLLVSLVSSASRLVGVAHWKLGHVVTVAARNRKRRKANNEGSSGLSWHQAEYVKFLTRALAIAYTHLKAYVEVQYAPPHNGCDQ
ncbi:hypothetical protein KSP39_PZI008399 [Platanthera zijinensis]|uniref:Uncharacterized protein n=1 Tax=Platanthera zijinensis TaxID=2320716 RepID=A0AAP0BM91_9ASPA